MKQRTILAGSQKISFEAAVSSMIGMTVNNMAYQDYEEFHQKHGENVGVFYLKSTRVVDC